MALKGNLREFSFVQLLNLINLAKKTGALYIDGVQQETRLVFSEGKLAYAKYNGEEVPLIRILARMNVLPHSQAASLGERYRNFNDKESGIFLINSGYLTQAQIFSGIESYYIDILRKIFSLADGVFHFELGELPPKGVITVRINLESIIVEGSRQLHEMEDLKNEIPSLEMALKFTDRPGLNIRDVNLNSDEWRVVSYVNPKNTIQQIAGAARMNELQIRRVVINLLQAGLVELVRPRSGVAANTPPLKDSAAQKSLVNRVIDRIKMI